MSDYYASSLLAPLALAAWWDLRHRRIPNEFPTTVVLLWLCATALGVGGPKLAAVGTGMSLLLLGILAWRFGWLGGGDVKLVAALGLWAGPSHDRLPPSTRFAPDVTSWRSQGLPYGIAVAAGGGWVVQRLLAA